jgi:hypothetical protein
VRNAWRAAALLGGLTLAAAVAACGGDDEAEPTATGTVAASPTTQATAASASPAAVASMTPDERATTEALLKAAALRLEDLPEGFIFQEEKFLTNEEAVDENLDYPGAPTVEDHNRWGRILEYEVTYRREAPPTLTGATLSIEITTALFRDSGGAGENLGFLRQQGADPEYVNALEQQSAQEDLNVRDLKVSPISFASVGEDRMAFEVTFTMRDAQLDKDLNFISQFIAIRRGRAIGALQTLAVGSPHPLEEVEDLARTLDERMKDALE